MDHRGDLQLQVVYVDNGSTDGSAAAAERAYPGVEVVRLARNEGLPARNHGLRRARGRNRMFIDTDATVTEGALQTMCAILDGDPGIGLVGPRLVYPDEACSSPRGGTLRSCCRCSADRRSSDSSVTPRWSGTT